MMACDVKLMPVSLKMWKFEVLVSNVYNVNTETPYTHRYAYKFIITQNQWLIL